VFVVRIRRDLESIDPDWAGRVEHLTSGRGVSFERTVELLEFIRRNLAGREERPS